MIAVNKNNSQHSIIAIKAWMLGFLLSEVLFFSNQFGLKLGTYILAHDLEKWALCFGAMYLLFIFIYLIYRRFFESLLKVLRSNRLDLLVMICAGTLSSLFLGGLGSELYKYIFSFITINQLIVILSVPFIICISLILRITYTTIFNKRREGKPFFIDDTEQISKDQDLLGYSDISEKFAERIINEESSNSLVFGVDAPWGIGKSSFVNFCKEYWKENYSQKVIVYIFNPLKYEDRNNLLEKFIDGLTKEIQKSLFMPEVKPMLTKYARLIRSVKWNIFGFLNLEVSDQGYTVDDAFDDLESALAVIDKKIIIVIDDLDRLNLSAVKDLLFTIKKSFTLPNISYVLCYDAENINSLEEKKPNSEKISEFLEKFINVKVSLYLNSAKLFEYVSTKLEKTISGNSQADPKLVSKAIEGLKDIYKSNDYYDYVQFVGDIRKVKRLINTILMLDIEKTDFNDSDINKSDLIHLLLIYIHYPNIFRRIYSSETDGKKGYFSLVANYEEGYPESLDRSQRRISESDYKNSIKYTTLIDSGTLSDGQKFLLGKIFNVNKRLKNANANNISIEERTTFACFNGDMWSRENRNLEDYLELIVSTSKPLKTDQYKFYKNLNDELLRGVPIETIFKRKEFSTNQSEANHKQLWKVIINSAYELSGGTGDNIVKYLSNNIHKYSHFKYDDIGLGLRQDLCFYLVKILDQAGWIDENGEHRNNTDENLSGITDWIFGEGKHKNQSIISTLSESKRGILGFYDLLSFRLYCSADRGNDVFNLTRALSKHGNVNAPTDGSTKIIAEVEMRIVSQETFNIFKAQYIRPKNNIFDIIELLNVESISGDFKKFVSSMVKSGDIQNSDQTVGITKSKICGFIVYQLGSSSADYGIACGFYDNKGEDDKHEISKEMNRYLFSVCFEPGKKNENVKNFEHFLYYLLISFASILGTAKGKSFAPHINEFTKVLDKKRLYTYWKSNREKIKALKLEKTDKIIYTPNYTASYKEDLLATYKVLDDFVIETEKNKKEKV